MLSTVRQPTQLSPMRDSCLYGDPVGRCRSMSNELSLTVVYNARKRGEDRASDYFKRTENIAGVKDMRFQALMPDILHWLGIKKIDRMLSMSK
jgi:GTP cyclohydrolase II